MVLSVLGSIREDGMFSVNMKDAFFQIMIHLEVSSDCYEWEGLPAQGIMFQPFHSTPGLHQSVLSSVAVSLQERNLAASLPGQLAGHRSRSLACWNIASSPLSLSGPGGCHQLGEIRPRTDHQGSVSQNAVRYHRRDRLGLLDSNMWRTSSFVFFLCLGRCGSRILATQPLKWFIPRAKARSPPLQWQLKPHWSASADDSEMPVLSMEE